MKITQKYLQKLIKEEAAKLLKEGGGPPESLEGAEQYMEWLPDAMAEVRRGGPEGQDAGDLALQWMGGAIKGIIAHLKNPPLGPGEVGPPDDGGKQFPEQLFGGSEGSEEDP